MEALSEGHHEFESYHPLLAESHKASTLLHWAKRKIQMPLYYCSISL